MIKMTSLDWSDGYEQWSLIRYDVPKDGHCLFHALSLAFFKPYIHESFNGKYISRLQVVKNLRSELAEKLGKPINNRGPRYYDLLNNGNTAEFAKAVPRYSLNNMMAELQSNQFIGYGYIEYIGNQLNKDIFILDGDKQKLYKSDEWPLTIKNRNAIVLYYQHHHFELVGIGEKTHFKPTHPFILFLKSKMI